MTHGTIHIKENSNDEYVVVLHTTHDGHTYDAFINCVLMPWRIYKMIGNNHWHVVSIREAYANAQNDLVAYMKSMIPLRTDAVNFASWIISTGFNHWFALPHKCNDPALLEYWGINNPNIVVSLSDERLPVITVSITDRCGISAGEWAGIKESIKETAMGLMDEYKFDDMNRSISYNLDLVFAKIVCQ